MAYCLGMVPVFRRNIIARHNFWGKRDREKQKPTTGLISSILIWTGDERNYTRLGLFCGETQLRMTIDNRSSKEKAKKKGKGSGNCIASTIRSYRFNGRGNERMKLVQQEQRYIYVRIML